MVNLETLTARGARAYELGRFKMAARVALVVVPLAAICLIERTGRETCACCSVALLGGSIWLRWRDRAGVESVTRGLYAGSVPVAFALVLPGIDASCLSAGVFSYCTGLSLLVGAAAGAVVAAPRWERRGQARWLVALTITALLASLGCARLSVASFAGVVLGIALAGARRPAHPPA